MQTEPSQAHDNAEIRQLITELASAICAKDVDRIMSRYATDAIVFNCKPPFQIRGADAWRRVWEEDLPCLPAPNSFGTELRDLMVFVNGDLALAHWLFRFTGMGKEHGAMQTWLRDTVGLRRKQGRWKIVHEHISVPFNPHTSQAIFTLEP
jgi:ketosteroid isomerase-like protein